MFGESDRQDYKLTFDASDDKAKVDLVKNLVAFANAGGGQIVFGRNETQVVGVSADLVQALDSARLTDLLNRFAPENSVVVSHSVQRDEESGNDLLIIQVQAAQFPVVMKKDGDWKGIQKKKGDRPLFRKGDIWTRHSTKTERISFEDMREWIERARKQERDLILSRITHLVNLPDGAEIQVVADTQQPIDNPQRLLEYAALRHAYDPNHLLTSSDLAHLFVNRGILEPFTEKQLRLLISSALRRPPTLFWWVSRVENRSKIVLEEIEKCLDAKDRDKSDAARSIIELAGIYAGEERLTLILEELRNSRYRHFREAADGWSGRKQQLNQLRQRALSARYDDHLLKDFSADELEQLATEVALLFLERSTTAFSRKLSDIVRMIWAKTTPEGESLIG